MRHGRETRPCPYRGGLTSVHTVTVTAVAVTVGHTAGRVVHGRYSRKSEIESGRKLTTMTHINAVPRFPPAA